MYTRIERCLKKLNLKAGKCLLVGDTLKGGKGNPSLTNMLPKGTKIRATDYPEVDIHSMPYKDATYDYVFADQVLEHVKKPWIAIQEIRRVLKPGGLTVLTTCLLNAVHGVPYDYWRYTPDGLRVLCEDFHEIHEAAGQGDLEFVIKCLRNKRGEQIRPGSSAEKGAMADDGKNLLHVWVIAEK
jgi:SAM-dependent methyltransferase